MNVKNSVLPYLDHVGLFPKQFSINWPYRLFYGNRNFTVYISVWLFYIYGTICCESIFRLVCCRKKKLNDLPESTDKMTDDVSSVRYNTGEHLPANKIENNR